MFFFVTQTPGSSTGQLVYVEGRPYKGLRLHLKGPSIHPGLFIIEELQECRLETTQWPLAIIKRQSDPMPNCEMMELGTVRQITPIAA